MAEADEDFLEDGLYDEDDDDRLEDTYLVFGLDGGQYAIGVAHVREIVRLPKFRPVPDVPECIRGVINLRGRVVPLMDARSRLGLGEPNYTDRTVVIVLEDAGVATGLVADAVNGVSDFPPNVIEPNVHGRGRRVRAVRGIAKRGDEVAIVLDVEKLLDTEVHDERTPQKPREVAQLAESDVA